MRPMIDRAFAVHSPGPVFCGMLDDMGWPLGAACEALLSEDEPSLLVTYREGWNLTGIPVETDLTPYTSLFSNASDIPFLFDNEQRTYQDAPQLQPEMGYWIHLESQEIISYRGDLLDAVTLSLSEGWNLVSGLGYSLPESAVQDNQGIINSAWYGFDGAYFTANDIEPGRGYWVRASQAGTITLEHSASKQAPLASQSEQPWHHFSPQQVFYGLHFVSESDTLQSLWFGGELPEQIPATRFVMPPLPPAEAFDARFAGSQSRLSEEAAAQITLQSAGRPLQVHLSTPGSLSTQSWQLLELSEEGREVQSHRLSEGEPLSLPPGQQSLLQISPELPLSSEEPNQPLSFSLEQNYPNPFNPTTQIAFTLPEALPVQIAVYNIAGQRIATLVNETMRAGRHSVTFDATSLTSGVYFYQMQAGPYQDIRKMAVVK